MHTGIPVPSHLAELVALAATFDMLDDAPTVPVVGPEPRADAQELAEPQADAPPAEPKLLADAPELAEPEPQVVASAAAEQGAATSSTPARPVTSWAAVARAVGKSDDTLARRRKAWGIKAKKPHFDSADEARQWYRRCEHRGTGQEPRTLPPRAPRTPRRKARCITGLTLADLDAAPGKRR